MTHEELIKKTVDAIKEIRAAAKYVIRSHRIDNLVNLNTGEYSGVQVVFDLSTKYDYRDHLLNSWEIILNADSYYINVLRNQLHIHFNIHY